MSSSTLPVQSRPAITDALVATAQQKLQLAAEHLLSLQHPDGYWCALLTADTTLESDYILLQLWMHPPVNGIWAPPDRGKDRSRGGAHSLETAARRRLQYLRQRPERDQRFGQSLFRVEACRNTGGRRADDEAPRANHRARAAFRRRTATRRSISACSISTRAKELRAFRRRSCCCRASCSIRCRPGRARS